MVTLSWPISHVMAQQNLLLSPSLPLNLQAQSFLPWYSNVSGNFNLIHMIPYLAACASFLCMITHDIFSSAATRCRTWTSSWPCAFRIMYSSESCLLIYLIVDHGLPYFHSYSAGVLYTRSIEAVAKANGDGHCWY